MSLVAIQRAIGAVKHAKASEIDTDIVVVNDNPKDKKFGNEIQKFCAKNSLKLIKNPKNYGFVRAVNEAAKQFKDYHAVTIVNSDTMCDEEALSCLIFDLFDDDDIGSATALSNNADSFSFGAECENADEFIQFCKTNQLPRKTYNLPTAIGHFAAFRVDAIKRDYFFDMEFGKGYGEENELSCHLTQNGFKHIYSANSKVFHYGGKSFGSDLKVELIEANLKKVNALYPWYSNYVDACLSEGVFHYDTAEILLKKQHDNNQVSELLFVFNRIGGGPDEYVDRFAYKFGSEKNISFLEIRENYALLFKLAARPILIGRSRS